MWEYPWSRRVALPLLLILAFAAWRLPASSHAQAGVTEATWSSFWYLKLAGTVSGLEFVPANNHTLTRFIVTAEAPPFECMVNATVAIKDMTTGTILTSLTITGSLPQDSGPLSISMTGGHVFSFVNPQGYSGCGKIAGVTQNPGEANFTAIYQ